jgi:hypothetical protein
MIVFQTAGAAISENNQIAESARASPPRKISKIFKKVLTQFRVSRQKGVA